MKRKMVIIAAVIVISVGITVYSMTAMDPFVTSDGQASIRPNPAANQEPLIEPPTSDDKSAPTATAGSADKLSERWNVLYVVLADLARDCNDGDKQDSLNCPNGIERFIAYNADFEVWFVQTGIDSMCGNNDVPQLVADMCRLDAQREDAYREIIRMCSDLWSSTNVCDALVVQNYGPNIVRLTEQYEEYQKLASLMG